MSTAGIWMLGLSAVAWLAIGSLTASGARRRGQCWRYVWLSGLIFPLTWVIWYVADERAAGGRATRRMRRQSL